jgi:F0F1-type ATP synthase assembly protein I
MEVLGRYLRYSHLGLQFIVSVGLPLAGGIWLDRKLGTVVLFTLVGLVLGFGAGLFSLYNELFRKKARSRQPRPKDKDNGR